MQSLIFQATIYLAAMVIVVPLARRLGLGSVLGYLGAGIVIGPVLGLVGHEAHELRHFAEFGVVIMLFLIGLELEPRALGAMWRRMVGLGVTEIVLATALISLGWVLAGLPVTEGLAAGMILSLSSTAIVLQTLSERDLLPVPGGRSAFAVLLTQDIAVIPMLILIPLLGGALAAPGANDPEAMSLVEDLPGWGAALVTLGAIAAVVLIGSYLVHHAFRYAQGARLREVNTALSLLLVVATALLMQTVGLSPALGTFLAGVLLANSEFRHELESDLEPFRGLLLGLFFLTVGAGMDFSVLAEAPGAVAAIVALTLVAKGGVLWGLGLAAGLGRRDRLLFTLSLAGAGEFGFVLLAFAEQQGVVAASVAEPLLMAIAMSMLMTPFLFMAAERIAPATGHRPAPAGDSDIAPQGPIIIAGIGRFGQVTNRL
ncbi:MAG: potassium transporter, partial [Alphaproteobacteria bacterium]